MLPLEYSGPTLHRLEALDANRPLLFGLRQHKNYHFHPPCCTDWYMKYFALFGPFFFRLRLRRAMPRLFMANIVLLDENLILQREPLVALFHDCFRMKIVGFGKSAAAWFEHGRFCQNLGMGRQIIGALKHLLTFFG